MKHAICLVTALLACGGAWSQPSGAKPAQEVVRIMDISAYALDGASASRRFPGVTGALSDGQTIKLPPRRRHDERPGTTGGGTGTGSGGGGLGGGLGGGPGSGPLPGGPPAR